MEGEGGGGWEVSSFHSEEKPRCLLKTKPQVFPLLFSIFFSLERERSGEGESLERFGVRGLGRFCQM